MEVYILKSNKILQGIGAMTLLVITFSVLMNPAYAARFADTIQGDPTAYILGTNVSVEGNIAQVGNISMGNSRVQFSDINVWRDIDEDTLYIQNADEDSEARIRILPRPATRFQ